MYTYSWFMFRFDRKQQNTVKNYPLIKKNENIFEKNIIFQDKMDREWFLNEKTIFLKFLKLSINILCGILYFPIFFVKSSLYHIYRKKYLEGFLFQNAINAQISM